MAKSQIIKDIANGVVDTQIALKRTKVLLQEFDNDDLLQWINYEIEGYPDNVEVPAYRIINGQLYGSYFKGSMASHLKYTDVSLSLGNLPEETKEDVLTTSITQSIESLKCMIDEAKENGSNCLIKQIPAEFYPVIAKANNDLGMVIYDARVKLNTSGLLNIFQKIDNKLLDILTYLEKQFGILDELDIDIESKNTDELKEITQNIYVMIYNDKSISIGNDNKIKNSKISSYIEEK